MSPTVQFSEAYPTLSHKITTLSLPLFSSIPCFCLCFSPKGDFIAGGALFILIGNFPNSESYFHVFLETLETMHSA